MQSQNYELIINVLRQELLKIKSLLETKDYFKSKHIKVKQNQIMKYQISVYRKFIELLQQSQNTEIIKNMYGKAEIQVENHTLRHNLECHKNEIKQIRNKNDELEKKIKEKEQHFNSLQNRHKISQTSNKQLTNKIKVLMETNQGLEHIINIKQSKHSETHQKKKGQYNQTELHESSKIKKEQNKTVQKKQQPKSNHSKIDVFALKEENRSLRITTDEMKQQIQFLKTKISSQQLLSEMRIKL